MAGEKKRSFVLYFDSYQQIASLSAQQRGELLLGLYEFAMGAASGQPDLENVIAAHPDMDQATKMALSFLSNVILRDTQRWLNKQARYSQAAKTREARARESEDGDMARYVQALKKPNREDFP